jgi:putative transposase
MPARNSIKEYVEGGIYHVYNRGVAKGDIFIDCEDYKSFLFYLKVYLLDPVLKVARLQGADSSRVERKSFYGRIELRGYCLMPNHIHLILAQTDKTALTEFMRCLMTNYVMYFNRKYERVGPLFQGKFKAILITHDEQLKYLSKYIHLNPCKGRTLAERPEEYEYSSYLYYLESQKADWFSPDYILSMFCSGGYQAFVENDDTAPELIYPILLEN